MGDTVFCQAEAHQLGWFTAEKVMIITKLDKI
jgi:hypothetical protein